MSARWAWAQQSDFGEGGGTHTADLVAPMSCGAAGGEDEDEEEEDAAALSADLPTWAVGAQVFHLLAWACADAETKGLAHLAALDDNHRV